MPICRLPPDTVRLLGSSYAISTPSSALKELIDNSIDAGATSIDIVLSSNTVEKLQVTDNGCGIAPEDFAALGRRASTSKLRSFDDLGRGILTLGFRGEALAGLNCVADEVTIKTRTAGGDACAQEFKLKPGAGGAAEDPQIAPGPVGTTVTVEGLFGAVPVRRQQAVKESRKTLGRIRDLLLAYAFARPHIKLSFKVPWEPGRAWTYHPCNHRRGLRGRDVALQKFEPKFVSECVNAQTMRTVGIVATMAGIQPSPTLTLESLLPSKDCKADVVKGKGAFISVDSRPIISTRGTAKKIVSIFRSYLSLTQEGGKFKPQSNPFIWLNIRCPPGMYDPNVAPLKDEVLFTDEKVVLDCFEELCASVYLDNATKNETTITAQPGKAYQTELWEGRANEPIPSIEDQSQDEPNRATNSTKEEGEDVPGIHLSENLNQPESGLGDDEQNPARLMESTPQFVSVEVRTMAKVNMARNSSDATHSAMEDTATTKIPSRPINPNKLEASLSRKPAASNQSPTRGHQSGDIYRFFPPASPPGFQIVTNNTATEAKTPMQQWEAVEGCDRPGGGLKVQKYLDSSRIGQRDRSPWVLSAAHRSEGPSQSTSPDNTPSWDIRSRSFLREPAEIGEPLVSAEPSAPNPPPQSALRTPPSSNPRRLGQAQNHPFRAVVKRKENDFGTGRVSLRPRVRPSLGTDGLVDGATQPGANTNNLYNWLSAERTTRRDARKLADMARFDNSDYLEAIPQSTLTNPTPPVHPGMGRQWSHTIQTMLMRSPPPRLEGSAFDGEESVPTDQQPHLSRKRSTPPHERQQQKLGRLRSKSIRSMNHAGEDPREYLVKCKRSEALSGISSRLHSTGLPLETIPDGMGTSALTTELGLSATDITRNMERLAPFHHYADTSGELPNALNFKDMVEVDEVEDRLKSVVGAWAAEQDGVEVGYSLRSHVKGKRKA